MCIQNILLHLNIFYFHIGIIEHSLIANFDVWDEERPGKDTRRLKDVEKIIYIVNLSRLSDTLSLLLKPFFCIELTSFQGISTDFQKHQKTTNESSSSTFPVITVNNNNIFRAFPQKASHKVTNLKKWLNRGRFMILPFKGVNISQLILINFTTTNIDSDIILLMFFGKKLWDNISWIPKQFLKARSRKSHGNNPRRDIGQIQIISTFFIPIFRPTNHLP